MKHYLLAGILCMTVLGACDKSPETAANLQFKVLFNPTQPRLNNRGEAAVIPPGNATQTPDFQKLSVHSIELISDSDTPMGKGIIVYKGPETTKGGSNAIDFDAAVKVGEGEVFGKFDLSQVPPGTYTWVRVSVVYQQYDIRFNVLGVPFFGDLTNQKGTLSSFVGFNTYINTVQPREKSLIVRSNKAQGFWVFETNFDAPYTAANRLYSGQAPEGATTVVNPLFSSSPTPPLSCIVTGAFVQPMVFREGDKEDRVISLSFSTQKSLEWLDINNNGQLDFSSDPNINSEMIVDMGLRGLRVTWD